MHMTERSMIERVAAAAPHFFLPGTLRRQDAEPLHADHWYAEDLHTLWGESVSQLSVATRAKFIFHCND